MPRKIGADEDPLIVHVVGSLDGGGAERWARELVPRLRRRGLRTEIITVYPPGLDADALHELGVPIYHRNKSSGFDPLHFYWLAHLLRLRAPAIVHTHQWAGKYVGRAAALMSGVPLLVHTEHSPNPIGRAERLLAELLWRRTDATIAFTRKNAEMIRQREPVRSFEIIRNGLPIAPVPSDQSRREARQRIAAPVGTLVYGVVASLQERKNPALALRAFAKLANLDGTANRLDFFGQGPLRDKLVDEAARLGLSERVRFHGFRSDVRDLLPALDVFVTVALHEIAPVSILEAMAAGLPVIGTPHPGTVEMVEQEITGLVVDWDENLLAAAMSRAAGDGAWRRSAGAAGRARVERDYNIDRVVEQHMVFYDRLIQDRRANTVGRVPWQRPFRELPRS